MRYAFGDYELDEELFELRRARVRVAIEPKVFNVLVCLVVNRDRVVTKDELIAQCWPDCFITDSALVRSVVQARKAVGDDGVQQRVIQTVRGRGYRFIAPVETGVGKTSESLRTLTIEAQQLLTCAAVIGQEFSWSLLEYLRAVPSDRLSSILERAVADNIVVKSPGTVDYYRFAQPQVRASLYEALSPTRRAVQHRLVATTLETLYGVHNPSFLRNVAYHYYAATLVDGDADKAIDYTVRAGEWAAGVSAYADAVEQYARAIRLLELHHATHTHPYGELLLALGEMQMCSGETIQGRRTLCQAAELGRELGSVDILIHAAGRLGQDILRQSTLYGTVETDHVPLLAEALHQTAEAPTVERAELMTYLAVAQCTSEPERAVELSHAAIALALQMEDAATQIVALLGYHWIVLGPDNIPEQLATALRIVQLAQSTTHDDLTLLGHHCSIVDLLRLGDMEAVENAVQMCRPVMESLGSPYCRAVVVSLRAMCTMVTGRLADAEQHILEAETWGNQVSHREVLTHIVEPQRLYLYLLQDRRQELELALPLWATVVHHRVMWRCVLAWFYSELGWIDEATVLFQTWAAEEFRAIPRDGDWLASLGHLALVCTRLQDTRCAKSLYQLLLPYAAYHVTSSAFLYYGSVSHYLGLLATTMTAWDEAQQHFETALTMQRQLRAEPLHAATQYAYARMLVQHGLMAQQAKAHELLQQAIRTAESLHLTRLAGRARTLSQQRPGVAPSP